MARTLRAFLGACLACLAVACGGDGDSPDGGTGPLPTLSVSQGAATLLPGDSVDLALEPGAPAGVTWRVAEGANVATVTSAGRVRALSPGAARIVVEAGYLADTVHVSVPRLGVLTNGTRHFCALTVQGAARCFGTEEHGELGDGAPGAGTPNVVAGGHAFAAISAGRDHTCGVRTDGVALCWGGNEYGQLGTGTRSTATVGAHEPVRVAGTERYVAIAAGESHTCALVTDGGILCWGRNDLGQLGSVSAVDCPVGALNLRCQPTPTRVAGTRTYRMLSAGYNFTCAVDGDHAAWCWGSGDSFSRGDDNDSPTFAPGRVGGIARFELLEAGGFHACAVTPAADTYCWGEGGSGQNGAGDIATRPQRLAALPPVAVVGAAGGHSCAVAATGEAWCWGANTLGALGNGSASGSGPMPVAVAGGRLYAAIAPGGFRTCAVARDGALYCWGEVFAGGMSPTPMIVAAGTEFQR